MRRVRRGRSSVATRLKSYGYTVLAWLNPNLTFVREDSLLG